MNEKTDILHISDNNNTTDITMEIDKNTGGGGSDQNSISDNLPCLSYINSVTIEIEDLAILLSYCPINQTEKLISKLNIYQLLKLQIVSPNFSSVISSYISKSSFDNIFPYIRDILFDIDASCDNHHRYSLFIHLLQFIHLYQPHIFSVSSIRSILLLKLSDLLPLCDSSSPLHFFFNYLSSCHFISSFFILFY